MEVSADQESERVQLQLLMPLFSRFKRVELAKLAIKKYEDRNRQAKVKEMGSAAMITKTDEVAKQNSTSTAA